MAATRKVRQIQRRREYAGYLYIAPWLIGFLIFKLYPFAASFVYSFTRFSLFKPPRWRGLQNYITMFTTDEQFWTSFKVTFFYVFLSVPGKLIFALFIAMILSQKLKFINAFRTLYYIPSIMGGSVAISILWKTLFMREGIVNNFLSLLFGSQVVIDWLGSPDLALTTLSLLAVWQFGSAMVLFLAALKQIPSELYESALVDGAGKTRIFFKITIPMITPIILFNVVMQTIYAFQRFTGAFVITQGGPLDTTRFMVLKIYLEGFQNFKMGYASAISWVLFLIIISFTSLTFLSSKSWVHYTNEGKR